MLKKGLLSCDKLFFRLINKFTRRCFHRTGPVFCPKTSIIFEKYEKSHSALLAYTCALWGFCSYLAMAV